MYTVYKIAVWGHTGPTVLVHAGATVAVLDPGQGLELREADLRACLAAIRQPYSVCCTSRCGSQLPNDRFILSWPGEGDAPSDLKLFVNPYQGRLGRTVHCRLPGNLDARVDLVRRALHRLPELAAAA